MIDFSCPQSFDILGLNPIYFFTCVIGLGDLVEVSSVLAGVDQRAEAIREQAGGDSHVIHHPRCHT